MNEQFRYNFTKNEYIAIIDLFLLNGFCCVCYLCQNQLILKKEKSYV